MDSDASAASFRSICCQLDRDRRHCQAKIECRGCRSDADLERQYQDAGSQVAGALGDISGFERLLVVQGGNFELYVQCGKVHNETTARTRAF